MAGDGEQQAMTRERLAEIRQTIDILMTEPPSSTEFLAAELLAEVERLRAALAAKTDSYERLHLINMQLVRISRARQADLVAEREQAMEIVRAVANQDCAQDIDDPEWMQCLACGGGGPTGDSIEHHEICYYVKARALLASAGERSGSDGQQPEQATCPVCGMPGRRVTSRWWCDGCNLPFRRPGEAAGEE